MTQGQLLFYSGAALLVLTVLLAVIFVIRRPNYDPGSTDAQPDDERRGGRGTGGGTASHSAASAGPEATEALQGETTELLREEREP